MTTLGEGRFVMIVDIKFLVVPYKNIYNCILGRTFLVNLYTTASPIHLNTKYHKVMYGPITIHDDLTRALKKMKHR